MDKNKDKMIENKDKISTEIGFKNTEISSFFVDDSAFLFIHKKMEKLVTAVYLVSNLFSDNEPIKWSLRDKTAKLLSFTLTYKETNISGRKEFCQSLKTKVLEVVSLLQVASFSGLVSEMNFSIINKEFAKIIEYIESTEEINGDTQLSKKFFEVESVKNNTQILDVKKEIQSIQSNNFVISDKSENSIKDTNEEDKNKLFIKRTNRQESIITILKKKSDLNIKDIAQSIKGCSEKTIQRELINLMEEGIIKRTGERRWSRYSLV